MDKITALRTLILMMPLLLLIGCQKDTPNAPVIDQQYSSNASNERIVFLILHYTAQDSANSLKTLTQGTVSSHYLVNDDGHIYQLVADDKAAWHAGVSSFHGRSNLNDTSLGIELVNLGIAKEYLAHTGYHPYHHYMAYDEAQIAKTAALIQLLKDKYNIRPSYILSHSDVAPQRKLDVGAKFPWERLYRDYGLGAWYNEADKNAFIAAGFGDTNVQDIKDAFRQYGYAMNDTPTWDKESQNVIYAFQLHFNPKNATGLMDLESWAILQALNKKYRTA